MAFKPGFVLEEELKKLPKQPGVYIMHDETDKILYVGKAVNLHNRVRSYFRKIVNRGPQITRMVQLIWYFEYIVTDSELEALILENNLIKEHRPKYNTMLKDDKTYPYVKVTVNEEYPRVLFSRRMLRDGAKYFGPFTDSTAVKDTIDLIHKLYHIRNCSRRLPEDIGKGRECLYYHLQQCDAPCMNRISKEKYGEKVAETLAFLGGRYEKVMGELEQRMMEASDNLEFEKAIEYRELLHSVQAVEQRQKITSQSMDDRDIIAMAKEDLDAVVQVFFIRDGRMIGRDHFHLTVSDVQDNGQILSSFVKQYYSGTPFIPHEVWIEQPIEDQETIEAYLSARRGQKVRIVVPQKGDKEKMVALAKKNARMVLDQDSEKIKREELRTIGAMNQIGEWIGLSGLHRMEAFDISNISGFESVGSMVVFENGKPKRNDYRKFRIRTVQGPNDYASMREVLTRRFQHGIDEAEEIRKKGGDVASGSFTRFPDLLMMDGGRGQVNIALEVLNDLNLSIPVCGMVKDDRHRTRGIYYNNVEIPIDTHSEGFKLVTRIQDEAHRFAIEYHRSLRGKEQVHSVLDDIPGIGPKRRLALMREFKTFEAVRDASVEELAKCPSMNQASAEEVYRFFHKAEHEAAPHEVVEIQNRAN
ncbi:excinuclease ABC subunit UvrC [[Clostridium] aminophilum]|uniref:excinuclease ABC subunit UvrC n=1 Tax=[Clostridium] aminophilum TaxID=1526 RepID=UPI003330B12B